MRPLLAILSIACCSALLLSQSRARNYREAPTGYRDTPVLPGQKWKVHDIERPRPALVTPGAKAGDPSSDAIVLFNGTDLSQWETRRKDGAVAPAAWKISDGYMEVVPGSGSITTKQKFGDIQLHIEWMAPVELSGSSQWRANSGVILMSRYELQVLDSHDNPTYADGQAGSIYGQWPPLVNAARKPGEWQVYDIVFEAPRWEGGKLVKPAYWTAFHNGVLIHNRKEAVGPMAHRVVAPYVEHSPEEPILLQDHDVPVRYRNIWVRRLKPYDAQ